VFPSDKGQGIKQQSLNNPYPVKKWKESKPWPSKKQARQAHKMKLSQNIEKKN
jgi:hypothetical protein